jgi:hypothetical protein
MPLSVDATYAPSKSRCGDNPFDCAQYAISSVDVESPAWGLNCVQAVDEDYLDQLISLVRSDQAWASAYAAEQLGMIGYHARKALPALQDALERHGQSHCFGHCASDLFEAAIDSIKAEQLSIEC